MSGKKPGVVLEHEDDVTQLPQNMPSKRRLLMTSFTVCSLLRSCWGTRVGVQSDVYKGLYETVGIKL